MRRFLAIAMAFSVSGCALFAPGLPSTCEVSSGWGCSNRDGASSEAPRAAPASPPAPGPAPPAPEPEPEPEKPGKPDKPDRDGHHGHHGHHGPRGDRDRS
jgi:hypothetical protein